MTNKLIIKENMGGLLSIYNSICEKRQNLIDKLIKKDIKDEEELKSIIKRIARLDKDLEECSKGIFDKARQQLNRDQKL